MSHAKTNRRISFLPSFYGDSRPLARGREVFFSGIFAKKQSSIHSYSESKMIIKKYRRIQWRCALAFILLGTTILGGTLQPPHDVKINLSVSIFLFVCAILVILFRKNRSKTFHRFMRLFLVLLTVFLLMLEVLALYRILYEHYPVFG